MACSKKQKRISPPFLSQTRRRTYLFPSTATATAVRAVLLIGLTFSALAVTTPPVSAQSASQGTAEPKRAYTIPAGPLEQALTRFASTAGIELSVDSALLQGKTTHGLTGSFTVPEGFAQLLRGQGLQVIRNAAGVYSLQAVSASSVESGNTTTLPVMVVATAADKGTATEGTDSYTTDYSSYGKGQTLKELPQTVTVMTRQRIDDQQLKTLDDLMIYTPGITVQQDNSVASSFYSRGFQITSFQIDGNSPMYGAGGLSGSLNVSQLDLAMFDHVEVLRGSDALYGTSGAPGGAINLVRYSNGDDIGLRRSFYLGGPDDRWLRKNNKQFIRLDQAIGTNWTLGIEASRAESKNYRQDMSWYEAINPITHTGSSTFRDRTFRIYP